MKIVTGALGVDHVTSNDDGEFNQGVFGKDMYILDVGNKLNYSIVDNNTITISDGDIIIQGRHAIVDHGTTDTITIETGTIGFTRNDLIVVHYEMDEVTGYEDITFRVIKGTEVGSNPTDPAYTHGDIRTGALIAEMPLYRVTVGTNASITSVTRLVNVMPSIGSLSESIEYLRLKKTQNFNEAYRNATDEIICIASIGSPGIITWTLNIPKLCIGSTARWYVSGHYSNSGDTSSFGLMISTAGISGTICTYKTIDRKNEVDIWFYYR